MEKNCNEKRDSKGIVLVNGIPGCGKSTFIENLLQENQKSKIYVISYDKIERMLKQEINLNFQNPQTIEILIKALDNEKTSQNICLDSLIQKYVKKTHEKDKNSENSFDSETWKQSRSTCFELVNLILDYHKADSKDFKIILDDNFLLKSMRKPFYILSHKFSIGYCELKLFCDLQTCIQRNSNRSEIDQVPKEIIEEAAIKIENTAYPAHYISHQNNDQMPCDTIHLLLNQIEEKLKIPVEYIDEKELEEARKRESEITKSNFIHQLDLKIRSIINTIAKADHNQLKEIFISEKITDSTKIKPLISFFSDFKNYFLECVTFTFNSENLKTEEVIGIIKKQKFFKSIKRELDNRKLNFDEMHKFLENKLMEISSNSLKNEKSYELYTNVYIEQIHSILIS